MPSKSNSRETCSWWSFTLRLWNLFITFGAILTTDRLTDTHTGVKTSLAEVIARFCIFLTLVLSDQQCPYFQDLRGFIWMLVLESNLIPKWCVFKLSRHSIIFASLKAFYSVMFCHIIFLTRHSIIFSYLWRCWYICEEAALGGTTAQKSQ